MNPGLCPLLPWGNGDVIHWHHIIFSIPSCLLLGPPLPIPTLYPPLPPPPVNPLPPLFPGFSNCLDQGEVVKGAPNGKTKSLMIFQCYSHRLPLVFTQRLLHSKCSLLYFYPKQSSCYLHLQEMSTTATQKSAHLSEPAHIVLFPFQIHRFLWREVNAARTIYYGES